MGQVTQGNKANFISAVQLYIPEILSTWHSYTTADQSLSQSTRLSYSYQPCELLTKTPSSLKLVRKGQAGYSLIKTDKHQALHPGRILCVSNCLQKENVFTPLHFSQSNRFLTLLWNLTTSTITYIKKLEMVNHYYAQSKQPQIINSMNMRRYRTFTQL